MKKVLFEAFCIGIVLSFFVVKGYADFSINVVGTVQSYENGMFRVKNSS